MRADIDKDGYVVVTPETYTEYYALQFCYPMSDRPKPIVIDASLIPDAMINQTNQEAG